MARRSARKDPSDQLTFGFDWARNGPNDGSLQDPGFLQGDTIALSAWTYTGRNGTLTLTNEAYNETTTSVRVSGGTAGETYNLVNTVTLVSGDIAERSILLQVVSL